MALEELGVAFIKLGQVLSTRSDLLAPDLVAELSKLRAAVAPVPTEAIEEQLRRELGRPALAVFASFDPTPLGSASIGQVHAARLTSGEEIVVKIQRPGVEQQLEDDIAVLMDLARLAQVRTSWGRQHDLPRLAEELAETLRDELDYEQEAQNAEHIRRIFAGESWLHVPVVYPEQSTRRVLVLERLRGIRIDDVDGLDAAGVDRHAMAEHLVRLVVRMVLDDGFFHADPHPGNFLVGSDRRLGMMDFGMVGWLDEDMRDHVLLYLAALADKDLGRAIDHLAAIGMVGSMEQLGALERDLGRFVARYWDRPLESVEVGRMVGAILTLARRHQLHVPAPLALMAKTMVMHEDNARRLDPKVNVAAMVNPMVRELAARRVAPERIAKKLRVTAMDAGELATVLPRRVDRLLGQLERGDLRVRARLDDVDFLMRSRERQVDRVAIAVLVAGFLVGVASLLHLTGGAGWQRMAGLFLWVGIAAVTTLAAWLAASIWLGRHR